MLGLSVCLPNFASRFSTEKARIQITVSGAVHRPTTISDLFCALDCIEQQSDFHCVTTWTCRGLHWAGYSFAHAYRQLIELLVRPESNIRYAVIKGRDGYRCCWPLDDLLADDVLLATKLASVPLSVAHGVPLRLVAPAHYGYKSVMHLSHIELVTDCRGYRPIGLRFMEHPRARVAFEERARGAPGWLWRMLYRPLVGPNTAYFRHALARYNRDRDTGSHGGTHDR